MKLFSAKLTKYKFLVLLAFCLVEIVCFIILILSYKSPYLKAFDNTKKITIEKTISITHTLNEILKLSLHIYLQDLKLVGKHMRFLSNDELNKNSQFYQNLKDDQDKQIYFANLEELKDKFIEYYNDDEKRFTYLEKYAKDYFENNEKGQYMLYELMNKKIHPELNSISYYKTNGNINNINDNPTKKLAAKYLISILKTNYIKRLIIKGGDLQIINYFLVLKDEIYFYPPEAYNNSLEYSMKDEIDCKEDFTICLYNSIFSFIENISITKNITDYIFPVPTLLNVKNGKVTNNLCLRIPFEQKFDIRDYPSTPFLCAGINLTKLFSGEFIQEKDRFNFIFFHYWQKEFIPVYSNKKGAYEEIKEIFIDPKYKDYSLTSGSQLSKYKLFHFLYFDLFKESSLLKKYNISVDDILKEFDVIKNKLIVEIENFQNTEKEYFALDIEKTTCQSNIYYSGKKCLKDSVLLVIFPLVSDYNLINEHFVDDPDLILNQTFFYSMSIISNNYEYMKWKISQIMIIYSQ